MISSRMRIILTAGFVGSIAAVYPVVVSINPVIGVAGCVFFFAPALFIGSLRGCGYNRRLIRVSLMMAVTYGALATACSMYFMNTAGYLTGDSVKAWFEMVRTTSQLYMFPFYFACIRQRSLRVRQRDSMEPKTVTLPGGIVVGIAFLPGSLMDTVVRSNDCRAAAYYFCSYVVLCVCTLAPATAIAWFGLVTIETNLSYLAVCSIVSISLCAPLFFFKTLNTPTYSYLVCWALVLALAATFLQQAYGGVELNNIRFALFVKGLLWTSVVQLSVPTYGRDH